MQSVKGTPDTFDDSLRILPWSEVAALREGLGMDDVVLGGQGAAAEVRNARFNCFPGRIRIPAKEGEAGRRLYERGPVMRRRPRKSIGVFISAYRRTDRFRNPVNRRVRENVVAREDRLKDRVLVAPVLPALQYPGEHTSWAVVEAMRKCLRVEHMHGDVRRVVALKEQNFVAQSGETPGGTIWPSVKSHGRSL